MSTFFLQMMVFINPELEKKIYFYDQKVEEKALCYVDFFFHLVDLI